MSGGSLDKIEKIDEIAQRYGQKGLRKLIVFKLLKMRVGQELKVRYGFSRVDQALLNKHCMEMADKIVESGRENPDEEDLRTLMKGLGDAVNMQESSERRKP